MRPKVKEYGMDRSQKAEAVAALNATFNEAGVVVVTRNLGMTVAQSTVLRTKMREAGASLQGCEEHARQACHRRTPTMPGIDDMLVGPDGAGRLRSIRSRPPRSRSTSPRRTTSSKSSADRWARRCSTRKGSRRSPRCRRSTSCAAKLDRPRPGPGDQDRPAHRPLPRPSWPASSAPMPKKKPPERFQVRLPESRFRLQSRRNTSWPISPISLKNSRS